MSISAADIARRAFDFALEKIIARAKHEVRDYVTREELEQAIIELRFADMQVAGFELDRLREEGKREEREAYERGREVAPPPENVTIIAPDATWPVLGDDDGP